MVSELQGALTLREHANYMKVVLSGNTLIADEELSNPENIDSSDEDYVPPLCIRTGGTLNLPAPVESLPTIAIDEMVHDLGEEEEPPEEPIPPDYLEVSSKDDIVGEKACLAYNKNLKQLTSFLKFPLSKCNQAACDAVEPFNILFNARGSETVIEWVYIRTGELSRTSTYVCK
ncbi:hypothetical protein ABVT39_016406 [Epinephelus coioides]